VEGAEFGGFKTMLGLGDTSGGLGGFKSVLGDVDLV